MNQRALWADPNVRRERQARAEAFMGRPMEFDEECAEMNYGGGYGKWQFEQAMAASRWQPPTDHERRLFMEAARHCGTAGSYGFCTAYCDWCNERYTIPFSQAEIAESLALDGADYDDMPDFEELER